MRIDSLPYLVELTAPAAVAKDGPSAAKGSTPAGQAAGYDRVDISPGGRTLAKLKEELAALPDLRPDRVALAKQNLQGGYRVDPAVLAQKMMEGTSRD